MRFLLLTGLVLMLSLPAQAQRSSGRSPAPAAKVGPKHGIINHFYYGYQWPGGDLYKRFGGNSTLGLNVSYKSYKNWLFGAEFNYMLGSYVYENTALDSLADQDGLIYDVNGNPAQIRLYERGYNALVTVGKVLVTLKNNENSGLVVKVGAGILQHKIKYSTNFDLLPQLDGDYIKGYDKLSNGFTAYAFAGYQHIDPIHHFHFIAGVEFYQAYTYNRRQYNYDSRSYDTGRRNDQLFGFKAGIILPIFFKEGGEKNEEHFFK